MSKKHPPEENNAAGRILDAALEVISQRGYSAAGVQEIVELSGTSKGSFYFHFPSKEEMVMALVERMSDKLIARVQEAVADQPTALHRLAASVDALMATFACQHKVAHVLLLNIIGHGKATDRKFLPIRERFSSLIQQELDAAVESRQIRPLDTALVSRIWVGALYEVIVRWLLTGQPQLTAASAGVRNVLVQSIGVDPDALDLA